MHGGGGRGVKKLADFAYNSTDRLREKRKRGREGGQKSPKVCVSRMPPYKVAFIKHLACNPSYHLGGFL